MHFLYLWKHKNTLKFACSILKSTINKIQKTYWTVSSIFLDMECFIALVLASWVLFFSTTDFNGIIFQALPLFPKWPWDSFSHFTIWLANTLLLKKCSQGDWVWPLWVLIGNWWLQCKWGWPAILLWYWENRWSNPISTTAE